jgi:hypothetical protein
MARLSFRAAPDGEDVAAIRGAFCSSSAKQLELVRNGEKRSATFVSRYRLECGWRECGGKQEQCGGRAFFAYSSGRAGPAGPPNALLGQLHAFTWSTTTCSLHFVALLYHIWVEPAQRIAMRWSCVAGNTT